VGGEYVAWPPLAISTRGGRATTATA
jgi:hypothetical protein